MQRKQAHRQLSKSSQDTTEDCKTHLEHLYTKEDSSKIGGKWITLERSLFSKLYFSWIWPILLLGRKRSLNLSDIPTIPTSCSSGVIGQRFILIWSHERIVKTKPSLWCTIFKTYWKEITLQGVIYVLIQLLQIGRSLLLGYFLQAYTSDPKSTYAWQLALLLILVSAGNVFTINPWNFLSSELGMNMCSSLTALIYDKSLRLSTKGLSATDQGKLLSLISNDVTRLETRVGIIHAIWVGPLVTIIVIIILVFYSPGAILALSVLGVIILVSSRLGIESSRILRDVTSFRDSRLKVIDQVVANIRQIKSYCWETVFEKTVDGIRSNEAKCLQKRWYLWAIYRTITIVSPRFVVFVALWTTVAISGELNAENVFLVTCLFGTVSSLMSQAFPTALFLLSEINVSISRCQEFLTLDETAPSKLKDNITVSTNSCANSSVCIQNFTGTRSRDKPAVLHNITLQVRSGYPLFLTGPIGSGKSSLLFAIFGGLETVHGTIDVVGKVAYVDQTPWVFPGTFRANITFGKNFNPEWYQRVLEACDLLTDIGAFPLGDLQVLSDKGISLSGGQKARIHLARFLYADLDVYLLDNLLSAVDPKVGEHILRNVVFGILKSKCVIMVTSPDKIGEHSECVFMETGTILRHGRYSDLCPEKPPLNQLSNTSAHTDEVKAIDIKEKKIGERISKDTSADQLYEGKSVVGSSILFSYLFSSGHRLLLRFVILLFVLFQILQSVTDLVLISCTNESGNASDDGHACRNYTALIFSDIFVGLVGLILFYYLCKLAGEVLHNRAFSSLLRTKLSFYSINTAGAILNRFSTDMGSIDEYLPKIVEAALSSILQVLGIVGVAVILNDVLMIPAIFAGILYIEIRNMYLRPSSDLRRLEATARTPVYTHFNTTMDGILTIKSLEQERDFMRQFYKLKDKHTSIYYTFLASFNWFIFSMDLLVLLFCTLSIAAFVMFPKDPAATGLAISLIFTADNIFSFGMQQTAELGNELVSVERMLEYSNLQSEGGKNITNAKNRAKLWKPVEGEIVFRNVDASYIKGTLSLQNINLKVEAGEKVGIVGRTGSGKSTLLNCILRLVDTCQGSICIDGRHICSISLLELRSSISVISQSPALVEGTLRYNLDIFNEFSDAELIEILNEVHLKTCIGANGLQKWVETGGANFSHGEKQLISLARALLQRNRILLLDEATANIDSKTEKLIQQVIETKFDGCTVIAISHNLSDVLHFNKIVVMDSGQIAECGAPANLLADKTSKLSKLVQSRHDLSHSHVK